MHVDARDNDKVPIGVGSQLYQDFLMLFKDAKRLESQSTDDILATLYCQGWERSSTKGKEWLARRMQHCTFISSLFILYEKLKKIQTRDELSLYFNDV